MVLDGTPAAVDRDELALAEKLVPIARGLHTAPRGATRIHPSLDSLTSAIGRAMLMANIQMRDGVIDLDVSWIGPLIEAMLASNQGRATELLDRARQSARAWFFDEAIAPSEAAAKGLVAQIPHEVVRRRWLEAGEYLPLPEGASLGPNER